MCFYFYLYDNVYVKIVYIVVKNVRCGVLDSYMNEAYLNLYLDNV